MYKYFFGYYLAAGSGGALRVQPIRWGEVDGVPVGGALQRPTIVHIELTEEEYGKDMVDLIAQYPYSKSK